MEISKIYTQKILNMDTWPLFHKFFKIWEPYLYRNYKKHTQVFIIIWAAHDQSEGHFTSFWSVHNFFKNKSISIDFQTIEFSGKVHNFFRDWVAPYPQVQRGWVNANHSQLHIGQIDPTVHPLKGKHEHGLCRICGKHDELLTFVNIW